MWNNWVIIFICSSLTLVELKLLEMSTRNVAVVVGQPCIIICQFTSTDNISSLHFTPLSSSKEVLIWSAAIGKDSKKFVDPFTVFKDHLNVTLYLNSTSLNSAGTFTWRGTNPIGEAYSAIKSSGQLIVLDGNLRCNSTVRGSTLNEYESVEMKCDIGYRGNWAPAMEWRFSGNDIHVHRQIVREGVRTIYVSNSLVVSVFNFTVYHTMNNRNVNCKTYFSRYTGNVTATATNPPDYSYTWISPSLNITYGPRNLAITPVQTSYRLGDKLTCSADANPTPMYEWKDNITAFTTLTKGPHYTIPSFVTPFAVECRASNPIGSDSRSVPINLSSGLGPQVYLSISLGALCFILILILVVIAGKHIKDSQARLSNAEHIERLGVNYRVQEINEVQASWLPDYHESFPYEDIQPVEPQLAVNHRVQEIYEAQEVSRSPDFQATSAYEDTQPFEPQSLTVYTDLITRGRVRLPPDGAESDELVQRAVQVITPPLSTAFELEDASELELGNHMPTQYVNVFLKTKQAHQYVNIHVLEEDVSSISQI